MSEKSAKRGAKPLAEAEVVGPQLDADKLAERRQVLVALGEADAAMVESAGQLAKTVGYEGPITAPALADGIRFYQHRTAEAALEIGKRLLLLKEITPHGEFQPAVEALGFSAQSARRFMAATLKFSKRSAPSVLTKAAISQTNLLELVVLDDEEIEALASGESVNGITLDDVESMSSRELRAALREAREEVKAKDERNQKLTEAVERAKEAESKAKRKWKQATPDEQSATLLAELEAAANNVRFAIAAGSEEAGLSGAAIALMRHAEENGLSVESQVAGVIANLIGDLRLLRDHDEVGVPVIADKRLAQWQAEG